MIPSLKPRTLSPWFSRSFKNIMAQECPAESAPITMMAASAQKNAKLLKLEKTRTDNATDISLLERATDVLKADGIVALPTDTLYGLAGLAQSTEAVNRIYRVKERHDEKPLSICVGSISDVYKWAEVHCEENLLNDLLPGPVTLLFKRKPELNPDLNPGISSIGVRIPDHDFVRDLCLACDAPLALTSANASATQSTLKVEEFEYLWPKIDLVVDGGPIGGGGNVNDDNDDESTPPKKRKAAVSSIATPSHSKISLSREGSTVVDLAHPGRFRIVRRGSALERTVVTLKDVYHLEEVE